MPSKNLETANVVLAANTFNVSIFNSRWLEKNKIFNEDELKPGQSIFLPVVTQIDTDDCQLLVLPERLQMILKSPQLNIAPLDKVRKIVEILPETPYTALGLNILWALKMEETEDFGEFTRRNFAVPSHPLYARFPDRDARFGTYLSKDFSGFRMKLDIKPISITNVKPPKEVVHLNFNFHLDLGDADEKMVIIKANLLKWTEAFNEAETVTQIFA